LGISQPFGRIIRMLMLVDAATLYFRAFYALPDSIVDPQGRPVNAVRGFIDGLRTLREAHSPSRIVVCWDDDWRPQWRVDLLPSYKTHRVSELGDDTPAFLAPQVPVIADVCRALGIPVVGAAGMEADDVVAALALDSSERVDVVSGDRDLTQLVSDADGRRLLYLGTGVGKHTVYDDALVRSTYGVEPGQYADFATLRGDPSDGIPGAAGIGTKTAALYLREFGSLEGILHAAETATPPLTKAKSATLLRDAAVLRATQQVVTLKPASLTVPECISNDAALAKLSEEFGLASVLRRWQV
jgi:5'-3' exonuclease